MLSLKSQSKFLWNVRNSGCIVLCRNCDCTLKNCCSKMKHTDDNPPLNMQEPLIQMFVSHGSFYSHFSQPRLTLNSM